MLWAIYIIGFVAFEIWLVLNWPNEPEWSILGLAWPILAIVALIFAPGFVLWWSIRFLVEKYNGRHK